MILTLTILSACSSKPPVPQDIPPTLFSQLNNNSAFFLKKDKLAGEQINLTWQFLALQALISEGEFILANSIIEHLQAKPLYAAERAALTLLIADSQFAQSRVDEAQQALNNLDNMQLSKTGYIYYLHLTLNINLQKQDHLAASDTLLLLAPLLTLNEEKQQYNDMLLTQLSLLPAPVLNQYQVIIADEEATKQSTPEFKQAWYALAGLYQAYQFSANKLQRSLQSWKEHYPTHPVLDFMPTQLTNIPESSPYQPENIALLIPLSGQFEQQGKAIQYGLLHAFYKRQQADQTAFAETQMQIAPKLHFFDTNAQTPEQIVAQFEGLEIDFVIGPLLKNKIKELLPLVAELPVLTLNSVANAQAGEAPEIKNQVIPWHYAFPLSPEEEAKQAAQLITLQQHKKPLLIAPDSAYGKRIANAFKQAWQAINPASEIQVEAHFFSSKAQLAQFTDGVLQTDKSKRRIEQMKAITNMALNTEVRSRRDIDAIYIISKRDELNLIKPFIDVSISPFAPSIPLYASSRSHLIDSSGKQNGELEQLVFSDVTFLLDTDNNTFKEVEQVWARQSFATLRLFALGFDSYQLIAQLMPLQSITDYTYQGLIGQLSLDQSNTVQARLSWAQYRQGKRIEIATPIPAK